MIFNGTLQEFIALTTAERQAITELKLHNQNFLNIIHDETFQAFLDALVECTSLKILDLQSNYIGNIAHLNNGEHIKMLCKALKAPALQTLEKFRLGDQSLNLLGFTLFRELLTTIAQFKLLRAFSLNGSHGRSFLLVDHLYNQDIAANTYQGELTLQTTYVQIFKEAFLNHPTLEELSFADNAIGELTAARQKEIYEALASFAWLKALNLDSNCLFNYQHSRLAFFDFLGSPNLHLVKLNIQNNSLANLNLHSPANPNRQNLDSYLNPGLLGKAFEKTKIQTLYITLHDIEFSHTEKETIITGKGRTIERLTSQQELENLEKIELFDEICKAIGKCHYLRALNLNDKMTENGQTVEKYLHPIFAQKLYAIFSTLPVLITANLGNLAISSIHDIQALNTATEQCRSLEDLDFACIPSAAINNDPTLDAALDSEIERNIAICTSHKEENNKPLVQSSLFFMNPKKWASDTATVEAVPPKVVRLILYYQRLMEEKILPNTLTLDKEGNQISHSNWW